MCPQPKGAVDKCSPDWHQVMPERPAVPAVTKVEKTYTLWD
jgi:hypothetical protein